MINDVIKNVYPDRKCPPRRDICELSAGHQKGVGRVWVSWGHRRSWPAADLPLSSIQELTGEELLAECVHDLEHWSAVWRTRWEFIQRFWIKERKWNTRQSLPWLFLLHRSSVLISIFPKIRRETLYQGSEYKSFHYVT